ncbi:NUDIX hydrolase [Pararhizobium sp. BT-229]|uniref:NUDIX hydrolase n=1 Tax=Pararhizobium sp. BT-229 TaxID=2986923 RepID=UPI0021F7418A|nr:NUDIX hydrolase [Pararhizobium sp. BT-229]MCV9960915.1 NUDIX hydrolase [Pararhizobium sp. BT-229]
MHDLLQPLTSNISEWPRERLIFPARRIDLRVIDAPHPYYLSERAQIAVNWDLEFAANPALYDGQMMLPRAIEIHDGVISGETHAVPYSTFLLWRKTRPIAAAVHLFSMPVIVSSDGAVVAIRMGKHTSNPGRVYCAAGSLDPGDVRDGVCDLDGNMAREVLEETGLSLSDAETVSGFHALHDRGVITVFRAYRFAATASDLVERIGRHIVVDPEPEIDEALAIRNADPGQHLYLPFMPPILEWVFNNMR